MRTLRRFFQPTFGLVLSLAFLSVSAESPNLDLDQGVDAAKVLETSRHQAGFSPIDKTLPAPALEPKEVFPTGPILGPLQPRVINSEIYKQAQEYPPLLELLKPEVRDPLNVKWSDINTERSELLGTAVEIEKRDQELYDHGVELERNADRLNRQKEALEREIDDFNRQCTGRPLPPDEYEACRRWRDDLLRRVDEHNREVAQHKARVIQWREDVASLVNRGTAFLGSVQEWEDKIREFVGRASKALADEGITRVRVQAQGSDPPVQKSVSLNKRGDLCKEEGEQMLGQLWAQLTESERADRDEAIAKAYAWVKSRPAEEVPAPPPVSVSFQNQNPKDPTARIDIEVFHGRAFVTCPCCAK